MAVATPSIVILIIVSLLISAAHGQLSPSFYSTTCPSLQSIVQSGIARAVNRDLRMGASLLRLFFHDCFVNGCDASVLLDDTATFTGEQNAIPNQNSLRGFDVIDTIKASVEAACRATVSCADILALAARDGVVMLGGPTWTVQLGRRDATTASKNGANGLPSPSSGLSVLIQQFKDKGLSATDLTALSGSHTIGQAQCKFFRPRIYNDTNIDSQFAATRQQNCPRSGGDLNLAPLDLQSPNRFGNDYFLHVMASKALLHSDQELFNGGSQDSLVQQYSANSAAFLSDFAAAMVRMGAITPLTGTSGEIRLDCGKVN